MRRSIQTLTVALVAATSFAGCVGGNVPSRPSTGADAATEIGDAAPLLGDLGAEAFSIDVATAAADTGGSDLPSGDIGNALSVDGAPSQPSDAAPDAPTFDANAFDANASDAPLVLDGAAPDSHSTGPDACSGCLTATGQCRPGTELGACGAGGAACLSCDDGNACTQDRCTAGQCFADPRTGGVCPGGICLAGSCACGEQGEPCCSTGPACQGSLACQGGTCGTCGGPGQPCCPGAPACAAGTACGGTPARCAPCGDVDQPCCAGATACRNSVCKASTSTCKPCGGQGQACCTGDTCTPDTDLCNGSEVCQAGVCGRTAAVTCPTTDACHDRGTCDPTSGSCSAAAPKSSGSCDDGNACTTNDICSAGICAGATMACNTPPAPTCTSATVLRTFTGPGTCAAGSCSYPSSDVTCPKGCAGGTCAAGDAWIPISSVGAPDRRRSQLAVWTGTKMLVWSGQSGDEIKRDGGIYDPGSDTWSALPSADAPGGWTTPTNFDGLYTAVWSGTQMIVFGWCDFCSLGAGQFDPAALQWSPLQGNFWEKRKEHSAVWTGTQMLIWGGDLGAPSGVQKTGYRYTPGGGHPSLPLPSIDARTRHSAVWTGSEMIVWGGLQDSTRLGDGAAYKPSTNTWRTISAVNAPTPMNRPRAVWTGAEMITWGYGSDDFGRYNPSTDTWMTLPKPSQQMAYDTVIWTGTEMIVWGSDLFTNVRYPGWAYAPATNTWRSLGTTGEPVRRRAHSAVWTGTEMIIWGGTGGPNGDLLADGSRYRP
jgi:hypothetical protein